MKLARMLILWSRVLCGAAPAKVWVQWGCFTVVAAALVQPFACPCALGGGVSAVENRAEQPASSENASPRVSMAALAAYRKGLALKNRGNCREAIEVLEKATRLAPDWGPAKTVLHECIQYADPVRWFLMNPQDAAAWRMAFKHLVDSGAYDAAEAFLTNAPPPVNDRAPYLRALRAASANQRAQDTEGEP